MRAKRAPWLGWHPLGRVVRWHPPPLGRRGAPAPPSRLWLPFFYRGVPVGGELASLCALPGPPGLWAPLWGGVRPGVPRTPSGPFGLGARSALWGRSAAFRPSCCHPGPFLRLL